MEFWGKNGEKVEFWEKFQEKGGILGKRWKKSEEWEEILDLGKKEGKMLKKGGMGEKRGKKWGKRWKRWEREKWNLGKRLRGKT